MEDIRKTWIEKRLEVLSVIFLSVKKEKGTKKYNYAILRRCTNPNLHGLDHRE
jgi:hypothetical protein